MSITEVEVVRSNVELAGPRAAEPCVLIVGEEPTTSAPTLTLSRALDRLGTTVRFVDANQMSRGEWIRQLRSATAIVLVSYAKVDVYLLSQLATAVAMDVPIVRWWVGHRRAQRHFARGDSPKCRSRRLDCFDERRRRPASRGRARDDRNSRPLRTIGDRRRQLVDRDGGLGGRVEARARLPAESAKGIFRSAHDRIGHRRESRPSLHRRRGRDAFAGGVRANVESLGWVWDMRQLYLRAGCILRITTHDGLPRMLIASLLHGLYAIYSWPLQGCWRARTVEEIDGRLAQYRMATRPNIEGRMAIQALLNGKPELQMADAITGSSVPARLRLRGMSLAMHTGIFAGRLG